MRFTEKPRSRIKSTKEVLEESLELVGLSNFNIGREACEERIYTLTKYLENVPGVEFTSEELAHLSPRAYAYAYFLAGATGWKVGEVIPREKKKDYDYLAVVSPNNEYFVTAGLIVIDTHHFKRNLMVEMYEKIKFGQLPPSRPEAFFDLYGHFFERQKAILFYPFEEEDAALLKEKTEAVLPMVGAAMDDSGQLINITVEKALSNLEKIIIEDRENFAREKKKQRAFLAGYSVILGHLIKIGCGYDWGKAWFGEMCGATVIYSPDKRYYFKPSRFIKSEFLSREKDGRLLKLYHRIKNNELPPQETEGLPDEIELE